MNIDTAFYENYPHHSVVESAVFRCPLCHSLVDRHVLFFQCRVNRCHFGDLKTGIITDHCKNDDLDV